MPRLTLKQIESQIPECEKCPELRDYCADVGLKKKASYINWDYWAKPVPGFGDPQATIWIVGLAPGAHGANRIGRMFTGDRSGDFLYAALHRAGLASQADSTARDDGLKLHNVYISAGLRCAPPANKPTAAQLKRCRPFLIDEWNALAPHIRVILALGSIAWKSVLNTAADRGLTITKPQPKFGHGEETPLDNEVTLIGSYHVSQQNTFTGRLTEKMFDDILKRCINAAG